MLTIYVIEAMGKVREPRNKVRFYVKKGLDDILPWLFIQKRDGSLSYISPIEGFKDFGLNPNDFTDMKEGEAREVFLNLKD